MSGFRLIERQRQEPKLDRLSQRHGIFESVESNRAFENVIRGKATEKACRRSAQAVGESKGERMI